MRKLLTWLCVSATLLLAGCSSIDVRRMPPRTDLATFKRVFVETSNNDSNKLDQMIVAELQRLGYEVTSGARTMAPPDAQLRVLYNGQWNWDFRTYLIQVDLTVRGAYDDRLYATASYFRPGVTKADPDAMVKLVVSKLFPPRRD